MSFNPVAVILTAEKVWPEPLSLPDSLEGAEPLELAEARSRLNQIVQVARELVKVIDQELAGALQGSVMEYGGMVIRPNNGRGSAKIGNAEAWWPFVTQALFHCDKNMRPIVMNALYPASSLRLTGLKMLATAADSDEQTIRDTFIVYDSPTSPLSVMPKDRAPKFLQDLEDGEIRKVT